MATFVAKNSGGVKKKPMIILKEFIFIRFSFNKRRQRLAGVRSAQSLQVFKSFFCYGVRLGTKSIITFRIVCFFCVKQQKVPATDEITG